MIYFSTFHTNQSIIKKRDGKYYIGSLRSCTGLIIEDIEFYDDVSLKLKNKENTYYIHLLPQTENKEISDVPVTVEDKIYNIPPDIRPKMTSYRLEVIFWGVRDMKKIKYMPVRRPRIIIECAGVHVKSEVMKNARRFSNFEEPRIMIELVISKSSREWLIRKLCVIYV